MFDSREVAVEPWVPGIAGAFQFAQVAFGEFGNRNNIGGRVANLFGDYFCRFLGASKRRRDDEVDSKPAGMAAGGPGLLAAQFAQWCLVRAAYNLMGVIFGLPVPDHVHSLHKHHYSSCKASYSLILFTSEGTCSTVLLSVFEGLEFGAGVGNKFGDAYREEMRRIHRRTLGRTARRGAQRSHREQNFGNGEVGGDANWSPPVHATATDGTPVTVSYRQGSRAGHQLVCRGHVGMAEFYARRSGHDHYGPDGRLIADRMGIQSKERYNLIMQEYTFKTPVAIAISETILRLAEEFVRQKNAQGIDVLDGLVADLIIDMPDSYVSFIDLQHYLWQVSDVIKKNDTATYESAKRELAGVKENLRDAREAYRKLVGADSRLDGFIPQARRES